MTTLRDHVLAVKQRLGLAHEECKELHRAGMSGVALCGKITDLRDAALLELVQDELGDLQESGPNGLLSQITLVAHAGYGRRDMAPFSDVDLMILHPLGLGNRVAPFAKRLLRGVFDAGLILGHSVRTPEQACRMAMTDPQICSSLVESRYLTGNEELFDRFWRQFRGQAGRRRRFLIGAIDRSRAEERLKYGETVFLLEPNVKRSGGTLRDLQLIRWIGFLRHETNDYGRLAELGALGTDDLEALRRADEFLLRLRNELHFHAGQSADVLSRAEQLRIAALRGYESHEGLLDVEQFMREYFRHTQAVSHIARRFVARAKSRDLLARVQTELFGHRIEEGIRSGPVGLWTGRRAAASIGRDLTAILRLVDLANLYDRPIAADTWEIIRRQAASLPPALPPPEACRHFLSLLSHPARLGTLLRDLHDAGLLERFIPDFARTRGLLQFNQYHKYTVDEHCLRAVEFAAELCIDRGPLGRVYRPLRRKDLLHLALLLHDLGKGYLEDHREVGVRIALEVARRLGLPAEDADVLRFLVHKHMLMNYLAFRRDTADEQLAVDFAVQVGSPDVLQMLYVLTAADLGAVGPDVWDGWKSEIVTDLYHRTMQQLAGDSPATSLDDFLKRRRGEIGECLADAEDDPWYRRQIDELPAGYLNATQPRQAAADLRLLRGIRPSDVLARGEYLPETGVCQYTIATSEHITPGIFHKLTGALSSQGLEIRAAQIHTLAEGLVLDRFWVFDPDYAGESPPERIAQIGRALTLALQAPAGDSPSFRRTWRKGGGQPLKVPGVQTRVKIDNSTSDSYTILDIFAHDRTGLLFAVTRTLFELGLSVARAKVGTYLDQVVDVFYVTDRERGKIDSPPRLEEIRRRLLEVIESHE
ncbi:MAG: [protein-PII] uridylyltransferase [Pirellulales bacterium]|nr:[protein-PII] uridylyltransferase [Pirellulales bacterium]